MAVADFAGARNQSVHGVCLCVCFVCVFVCCGCVQYVSDSRIPRRERRGEERRERARESERERESEPELEESFSRIPYIHNNWRSYSMLL